MSYQHSSVGRASYSVPISESSGLLGSPLDAPEHLRLADYEPAFRPLAEVGLAAIAWAGRERPSLLEVPPLNDLAHPPLHPDFVRQAKTLNEHDALIAQAGAAVLAITAAYQNWVHTRNVPIAKKDPQVYETRTSREITAPATQWRAGDVIYHPGCEWRVSDLAVIHSSSIVTGGIRLSAAISAEVPPREPDSPRLATCPTTYYCLNLETQFYRTNTPDIKPWAAAQVEAGVVDNGRFMVVDQGAGFDRLVKAAQVINSLAAGEGALEHIPANGYSFKAGRPS